MAGKGSDILNKVIVALLFVASIGFFANADHTDIYVLPGILFAAGGFVLALRRDRRVVELEPEVEGRLKQLTENLAATHSELVATQERLERLTEEQDFMRQLGARAPAARPAEPAARPLEMPASPRTPELSAPPPG